MVRNYYTRRKMSQIILDLIYLEDEMNHEGHTDNETLERLKQAIQDLRYYLQFLPKDND